jgi:hypothetical protein
MWGPTWATNQPCISNYHCQIFLKEHSQDNRCNHLLFPFWLCHKYGVLVAVQITNLDSENISVTIKAAKNTWSCMWSMNCFTGTEESWKDNGS